MKCKITFLLLIFILFLSNFFSCRSERDLDLHIAFFEQQSRDPRLFGTWMINIEHKSNEDVRVVDFFADGRCDSNLGFTYLRYYTKDGFLYLLTSGVHSSNPIVVKKEYTIEGKKLTITDTEENFSKSSVVYIKLDGTIPSLTSLNFQ